MVSSSGASVRRRRAESALKRAIESNQVVTAERPSNRPACCHTSKNTSLNRHGFVADEPEQPTIDVGPMAGEQHLHGKLVARRDALELGFVGGIFPCRGCNRRHCGGGRVPAEHTTDACDFPYVTSRPNKTGRGKKFMEIFLFGTGTGAYFRGWRNPFLGLFEAAR